MSGHSYWSVVGCEYFYEPTGLERSIERQFQMNYFIHIEGYSEFFAELKKHNRRKKRMRRHQRRAR